MTDIAEKLSAEGIRLNRYTAGNQKTICPKCSHTRRNKTEPCLKCLGPKSSRVLD